MAAPAATNVVAGCHEYAVKGILAESSWGATRECWQGAPGVVPCQLPALGLVLEESQPKGMAINMCSYPPCSSGCQPWLPPSLCPVGLSCRSSSLVRDRVA